MRTINVDDLKKRIVNDCGDVVFNCVDISCHGINGIPKCIFLVNSNRCGGYSKILDWKSIKKHDFGRIKNIQIKHLKPFLLTTKLEEYETD